MKKELIKKVMLDTKLEIDSIQNTKLDKRKKTIGQKRKTRIESLERYHKYLEKIVNMY